MEKEQPKEVSSEKERERPHKMSMASKLSIKLGSIFSNDKKQMANNNSNSSQSTTASIEAQQEKLRKEEVLIIYTKINKIYNKPQFARLNTKQIFIKFSPFL